MIGSWLLPLAPLSCADNFWWIQLFQDDLEAGASHWDLDPGWTVQQSEDGNHFLAGRGRALARLVSQAPWKEHRLGLRVRLLSGEFGLRLRDERDRGYLVRLRDDRLALCRSNAPGAEIELASAALPGLSGNWHTLIVTLNEDHLMVALDGAEHINHIDLAPVRQGQLLLQAEPGCQVEVDDLWITGLLPLPEAPPDATRITTGAAGVDGMADIRGAAGAVPGEAVVFLVNPQTLDWTTTTAASDGSFTAQLFAPEGSTVQINYAFPGALPFFENIGLQGSPAVLLTVHNLPVSGPRLPFTLCESLVSGYWIAHGELLRRDYLPGNTLTTTLHLRLESSQMAYLDLALLRIDIKLGLCRLFDEAGRQLPPLRNLVSAYLTPSGLPVEAEMEAADPWLFERSWSGSGAIRQDRVLTATLPLTLEIPSDLPAGIYRARLKVEFWVRQGEEWVIPDSVKADDGQFMLERQDARRSYPWPLLPPLRIGSPQPPRIAWMLLADYASNSERGVRAREDTHYCLSPRTIWPTHRFIVPMNDEASGEPISYILEPSLPLTSWGFRPLYERVLLDPPSIPLAYPGGELHVQVQRPDGVTDDLGAAAFVAGLNPLMNYRPDSTDPTRHHRTLLRSFGNPGPSDYYRAWTGGERFRYTFTQYGRYVITLSGQMQDIWGNVYQAGGTYEVWVAHLLDLELGTLPGTPFEVGDAYAPVVRIQPAVPAKVMLDYALYVNSSLTNVQRRHIEGRANRFGYFHPGKEENPLRLEAPGEYDVLVTASYWDERGELWMGAVRGANVVETPGTRLVAHGERGIRSFAALQRPHWFAEGRYGNVVPDQTDGLFEERYLGGALHIAYPYFTGDVMWIVDWEGENSIFPTITFQDTSGEIADLLEERVPELHQGAYYYGQFPLPLQPLDRRAISELPLVTTTTAGKRPGRTYGWPVGQFPDRADQIGYFYSNCVRPDLSVACLVSESGLGNAYWFADDNYNLQYGVGGNGDLTPDFKLNYGGVVFRDLAHGINEYAIYNSSDIYIPVGQELSNRVMPPFRGAAGGPDGGPLMTIKGQDIDLFVHPTGVKPGSILEVGDTFSFAAQVVPTLDSHVTVTVTMPSGGVHVIAGRANKIGYFYDPAQDFVVTEAGLYTVRVKGVHRGMTSAGPVYPPYPQGDVLGSDEGLFYVYVVERSSEPLALHIHEPQGAVILSEAKDLVPLDGDSSSQRMLLRTCPEPVEGMTPSESAIVRPAQTLEIAGTIPPTAQNAEVHYTISLSGFILQQGKLPISGGTFTYTYDPVALHQDFPNLDVTIIPPYRSYIPWREPEAVDTVQMNFCLVADEEGRRIQRARAVTLQGVHLFAPAVPRREHGRHLPLLLKQPAD